MRARLLGRATLKFGMPVVACAALFAVVTVPAEKAGAGRSTPVSVASGNAIGGGQGSGQPVDWRKKGKRISPDEQIRRVRREDGIVMFGDSISVQDGESLGKLLASTTGDQLATNNWSARPTGPAVDALQQWADDFGLPHRILIALGSNDVFEPSGFAAQIDRVMRIAGPDRTVFWVSIYVGRTKQPADVRLADQQNSQLINAQLEAARQRYPNLRIVPWAEYLAADPQRIKTDLRDGVHPSVPVGQKARNTLIINTIRAG